MNHIKVYNRVHTVPTFIYLQSQVTRFARGTVQCGTYKLVTWYIVIKTFSSISWRSMDGCCDQTNLSWIISQYMYVRLIYVHVWDICRILWVWSLIISLVTLLSFITDVIIYEYFIILSDNLCQTMEPIPTYMMLPKEVEFRPSAVYPHKLGWYDTFPAKMSHLSLQYVPSKGLFVKVT